MTAMSEEWSPSDSFSRQELAALVPYPSSGDHKYSRGRLFLIAGSAHYPGAACLAASASQRMGAGYTHVFAASDSVPVIQAYRPSLVVASWDDMPEHLPQSDEDHPCALVIGPGMIASRETNNLLAYALRAAMPLLIDGGALAELAADKSFWPMLLDRRDAGLDTLLTPHAGEAATLAEPFGVLSGNPADASYELADIYCTTVLLKGPDTYIAHRDRTAVMADGTAVLAKAGSGDVLAGMIGALLAQGVPMFEAAYLGAYLHANAGLAAALRTHAVSVIPEDIVEAIPTVIALLEHQAKE